MNIDYILMAQGNADKINPNSNPNDWSSLFASLGQLFFLVVVVVFVLILTVYTTKLIARVKLATNKNGNLQIIESLSLGYQQTALQLIKAGNKYFVIGITKDRICYLTEIDSESVEPVDRVPLASHKVLFEKYLQDFIGKSKKQN